MPFFRRAVKQNETLWLIAGLGNPGPEYEDTRHNCGFLTLDILAKKLDASFGKQKFKGTLAEVKRDDKKLILLKPLTYMNNSGAAVQEALHWYKIPESRLLVIYDDVDLESGLIRIRSKGSAGSHNGMKSVLRHTEEDEFTRIRIGIGATPHHMDIAAYVLGHFQTEERKRIDDACEKAAEAVLCIIREGTEKAMSRFNGKKS